MKVLYVHERFGALAGAEANVYITATELKRRGHEIGILHGETTNKGESDWRETFQQRFALYAKDNRTKVRTALATFQPDVVYVHKMAQLDVIETLVESGVPLIRMVHDHDIYCMRSYKYHYFSRKICTRAAGPHCIFPCGGFISRNRNGGFPIAINSYSEKLKEIALNRQFDRMVVVTTYMRDELLRNLFNPRKIEIHPPVPRMSDPSLRSTFSDRNLILFAGQIIRGKGVDVLLRALALVKTPFQCIILGDGSHRKTCEKLCKKLGLNDRVKFGGFVPQKELKNFYRECTLFAISSVWPEPFATVGVEVMRFGIPVVAFDAGGIKDWLIDGHNGYLVELGDLKKYAESIERLLNDKALARKMGEQGRTLVNERYDFDRYIEDLEDMFTRVISERQNNRVLTV